jgi:hypothetical protein
MIDMGVHQAANTGVEPFHIVEAALAYFGKGGQRSCHLALMQDFYMKFFQAGNLTALDYAEFGMVTGVAQDERIGCGGIFVRAA